jgi:hypothetical protein
MCLVGRGSSGNDASINLVMRQLHDTKIILLALFGFRLLLVGSSALAEDLIFGPDLQRAGWAEVRFPFISPASFRTIGEGAWR